MKHDGIGNSLPHLLMRQSIETSIEHVDKLKTKQSDTPTLIFSIMLYVAQFLTQ